MIAGLGAVLLIGLTFAGSWHEPASAGRTALGDLGLALTLGGLIGALWVRGERRRKAEDGKHWAVMVRDLIKAVRAICVETALDSRRQNRQAFDELTRALEEDATRRAAAVEAMRREVFELRSIVAGSFSKATASRSVAPLADSTLTRELAAKVDDLTRQVAFLTAARGVGSDPAISPVIDAELRGFLNGMGGPFGPGGPPLS